MNTADKLKYLITISESDDERISPDDANRQIHDEVGVALDADAEVAAIADAAVALGKSEAQRKLFSQLVDLVRCPDDQRTDVSLRDLQTLDVDRFGGWKSEDYYIPTSRAATNQSKYAPAPQDRFGIDGDHVYFQCPQAELPAGLCYIALAQPSTGMVTVVLARLKLIGGAWRYRSSLLAALKDKPTSKVEAKYVIPANEDTRTMFDSPEVAEFIRGLPHDDAQYVAAVRYLGWKEASGE